jgi:peptidoglycan/xylan/chitin deacetylase (PgdA/CDA1 family)
VTDGPDPLRQAIRFALGTVLPRRLFLLRGSRRSGAACLTFDDGPHPEHTPRLLDALAAAGVHATFFVIGERAERHPDLVRRIVAEGHELGHHSFTHGEPSRTSSRELIDEVRRTRALLADLTGIVPRLFRPPHGKVTVRKLVALIQEGETIVLWNVDPKDFEASGASEVLSRLGAHPLRGGDVVLLHDTWPHAALIMPGLARGVREKGLHFATVGVMTGRAPSGS